MKEGNAFARLIRENLDLLISMAALTIFLTCILSTHKVPSSSMEPTIHARTIVFCLRLPYLLGDPDPQRGQILVFKDPDAEKKLLIKRVIGVAGDVIEFRDGFTYLNGEKLEEDYLPEEGITLSRVQSYTVPEGCFFVMGDNRLHSQDSRYKATTYMTKESIYSRYLFSLPFRY